MFCAKCCNIDWYKIRIIYKKKLKNMFTITNGWWWSYSFKLNILSVTRNIFILRAYMIIWFVLHCDVWLKGAAWIKFFHFVPTDIHILKLSYWQVELAFEAKNKHKKAWHRWPLYHLVQGRKQMHGLTFRAGTIWTNKRRNLWRKWTRPQRIGGSGELRRTKTEEWL